MTDLIKRTYRITKSQEKAVKKIAKQCKLSESGFIRGIIEDEMNREAVLTKMDREASHVRPVKDEKIRQ